MAEADRRHEEQVARDQARQRRCDEATSFLNAILGELSSLQGAMRDAVRILNSQIGFAEELARRNIAEKTQPRVAFRFVSPVFDGHVSRVGLLSPDLSFTVSKLFGQVKGFNSHVLGQVPDMEPVLAIKVMRSVEEGLKTLMVGADALKQDLREAAGLVSTDQWRVSYSPEGAVPASPRRGQPVRFRGVR